MQVNRSGIDLSKSSFQVHSIDTEEKPVITKKLRRSQVLGLFEKLPPHLIGIEACGTAHHWARELGKLGHTVRLIPARDVKAYVKRGKNDAADAEAICEAVGRPGVRTVPVKSEAQQTALLPHRTRDLLIRQRTQASNALRAHLAEFGIVAAQGREGFKALLVIVDAASDPRLPAAAYEVLRVLAGQVSRIEVGIAALERQIHAQFRANPDCRRLETIMGVGVITATALVATVHDPKMFAAGRDLSAWIGLVPRQESTAGKPRLGPISKQGDRYLRRLFITGAHAVIRQARLKPEKHDPWLIELMKRKSTNLAAVALANKMARTAWALLVNGETYRRPQLVAAA